MRLDAVEQIEQLNHLFGPSRDREVENLIRFQQNVESPPKREPAVDGRVHDYHEVLTLAEGRCRADDVWRVPGDILGEVVQVRIGLLPADEYRGVLFQRG